VAAKECGNASHEECQKMECSMHGDRDIGGVGAAIRVGILLRWRSIMMCGAGRASWICRVNSRSTGIWERTGTENAA